MIDRHQRRALPASGDIGGAKVVHHGQSQCRCECRTIADLHREAIMRPMQNRLAVKAHDIDRAAIEPVRGKKRFHRLGMRTGD